MDSRENRSSSQQPGMLTTPNPFLRNPNPNPNPAAIMIGGGSISTPQSSSHHRLPFDALSLPNQHRQAPYQFQQQQMDQRTLGSLVFGDGAHLQSNESQQVRKRGRGRPRKLSDEHYLVSPLLSGSNSHGRGNRNGVGNTNSSDPPTKRSVGRPRSSAKRQQLEVLGASGIGFMPHVIKVKRGEDIATKLREFSEQGQRPICIFSATGTVGKVTFGHNSSVTGITTCEGLYEIVTLSGSLLNCEVNGTITRIGSLNVALAGNDGKVIGGGVIGELIAATDVQVVVGSFLVEPKKQKRRSSSSSSQRGLNPEASSGQANVNPFASPRSQEPSCDSSGDNESCSHPVQPPYNMSSSNRGSSGNSAAQQQQHQQLRQEQQEQQWQQQQEKLWQQQQEQQWQQQQEQLWQQQQEQQWQQQRQQQQEQQWQQQRQQEHEEQQQRQQEHEEQQHRQQEHEEQQHRHGLHFQYDLWLSGRGL